MARAAGEAHEADPIGPRAEGGVEGFGVLRPQILISVMGRMGAAIRAEGPQRGAGSAVRTGTEVPG